jgi:hypothetical protein
MKEFFAGVLLVLVILVIGVSAGSLLSYYKCEARWVDYEHRWSFTGGCQVKEDGKWTPVSSLFITV